MYAKQEVFALTTPDCNETGGWYQPYEVLPAKIYLGLRENFNL